MPITTRASLLKTRLITHLLILCAFVFLLMKEAQPAEAHYINFAELSKAQQATVNTWVNQAIHATEHALGQLKQSHIIIELNPKYFTLEPVPWASVIRGDQDGVELHFNRYASAATLIQDWTLYHELAHLYHPLFNYKDFWVSEGLATYLQNVIMFNAGLISRAEFTHRLWSGLQRGKLQTRSINNKLYAVTENMWPLKAQQRVYWTGAAFFIEAEIALNSQRSPRYTVSELLKQYQKCCRSQNMQAKTFMSELDKISQTAIFSNLYQKYKARTDFPTITKEQISQLHY